MGHGAVSLAVAGTANFLDFTTDGFVLYLFASSHPALFQVGCFFLALSVCAAWFFIFFEDFGGGVEKIKFPTGFFFLIAVFER